jgi:hypothetical protein
VGSQSGGSPVRLPLEADEPSQQHGHEEPQQDIEVEGHKTTSAGFRIPQ